MMCVCWAQGKKLAILVSHSHFMLSHLVPITVLRHVVVSYFLFPLPLFSLLTKPNSLTYADVCRYSQLL
ncbi:hypothetical protein BDR03DRAFT_952828 [Suillus americanus]|nr:hypothetical protein BDR03DRAFT_952828 [Suillus americanus]